MTKALSARFHSKENFEANFIGVPIVRTHDHTRDWYDGHETDWFERWGCLDTDYCDKWDSVSRSFWYEKAGEEFDENVVEFHGEKDRYVRIFRFVSNMRMSACVHDGNHRARAFCCGQKFEGGPEMLPKDKALDGPIPDVCIPVHLLSWTAPLDLIMIVQQCTLPV